MARFGSIAVDGGPDDRFRVAMMRAPVGMALVTPDGHILEANASLGTFLGRDPADLVGSGWQEVIHPEDVADEEALVADLLAGRVDSFHRRKRYVRPDGTVAWGEIAVSCARDAGGAVAFSVVQVADITEQVRAEEALRVSEERHRLIAENGLDVIWTMAQDGRITYVSPSVEQLRGYTAVEAMAQPLQEILTPASAAESAAYFAGMLADVAAGRRPGPYRGEQEYLRRDGSTIWCDVRAYPILAEDGRLVELLGVSRDLTEHRRVEADLVAAHDAAEAARSDLAEVQRIAHVGSWTWNPATNTSTWSDEFCRIAGVPPGSPAPTVDQGPLLCTSETWVTLAAALERAVRDGTPYEVLVGIVRPDGSVRDAIARAETERDDAGRVVLLRGTVIDVTDAHRAQDALRAREAELTEAQRIAGVGSWTLVPGVPDTWSDGMFRIHGLEPGSWVPTFPEYEGMIGSGSFAEMRERVGVALATGEPYEMEFDVTRPDGEPRRVISRAMAIRDATGAVIGLRGTHQDVTAERRAAAELRDAAELQQTVLDALADGIVVQDLAGRITLTNPAARRILGLREDEIEGRTSFDPRWQATREDGSPFPGDEHPAMVTLATGDPCRDVTMGLGHPDGRRIWIRITSEALRDAAGEVIGVVASFTDISAERELAERLRQGQRLEAVGQLAGGIAHDFNNLLAAIRGSSELLRAELSPGTAAQEDVDEIIQAADRAAALTRQLLAFSRRQPLRPEVVDPAAVVEALVPMLGRLLGEHIDLVVTRGEDACLVRTDPSQLEQVVTNLAVNSRDAMPEGGRLTIGVHAVEAAPAPGGEARPRVRITVADTGSGIDPSVLPRIFEPFFTTKDPGQGSGMGLATVYGIVGASDGTITADSVPGDGTVFTIDLPRVGGVPSRDGAAGPPPAARPSAVPAMAGTLLLVEDEPAVRRVGARMLRDLGYAVIDVGGSDAALTLNGDILDRVDALVTDVIMPGMHGPRLADRIEERRGRPIATVLISGYAPDEGLTERLARPDHAFVGKPFTQADLAAAVSTVTSAKPAPDR